MRIPEGPAGRRGLRWPFCGAPRCSELCAWGNCPRVPSAVTAGCRPIFQKDLAGVGGGGGELPADASAAPAPARVRRGRMPSLQPMAGGTGTPCHPRATLALPSGADGCGYAAEPSCVIIIMLQS